jgi:predicted N-acetyltransferase YhbS
MIMVGPVAVLPAQQSRGYGQALMTASLTAIDPRAPLPQVLIGDPDYYGRFFGFSNAHTADWQLPGPFEAHRLLCRTSNPAVLPPQGMLGPWRR